MKTIAFYVRPNACLTLSPERVLCNDVTLPWEYSPHSNNARLWIVCNEFGALGAVWARCEQDALDELVDSGLGGGLLIDEKDADEETARLGNAGEPADLTHAQIIAYSFEKARDCELLCQFAEARGQGADNLDKL